MTDLRAPDWMGAEDTDDDSWKTVIAAALAAGLSLPSACLRAQDQTSTAETPGPSIAVGADTVSDADISNRIDGIILACPRSTTWPMTSPPAS